MSNEGLQRTLVVGLGGAAARVVDRLMARLAAALGPLDIAEGIAVQAEDDEEMGLTFLDAILTISYEASLSDGVASLRDRSADLRMMIAGALRRISHLDHLATLAARGLTLRHADEVHLILVADLSRPWVAGSLTDVAGLLHDSVYHTLGCDSGLTGLLLFTQTGTQASTEHQAHTDSDPSSLPAFPSSNLPSAHPLASRDMPEDFFLGRLNLFNRGCFIVSLTNESGLIVGDTQDLIGRAAHFLALLITSPLGSTAAGLEWVTGDPAAREDMSLASFGLATARWPGWELVQALSRRWAEAALAWLIAPAPEAQHEAKVAVQRLVAAERLSPPLLVEGLAELMPELPGHLADEVPAPPWPWLLVDMQKRLETVARGWEEAWVAARGTLKPALAEIAEASQSAVTCWLVEHVTGIEEGALTRARAYLAALDELLEAFIEGVEAQVEEAETDLAAVERRMSTTAACLASLVVTFPPSPLEALLRWGLRPMRWLKHWAECRQAQSAARQYAHLLRARFTTLQAVWLYEVALPFYREWATTWRKEIEAWEQCAHQVTRARGLPALRDWPEQVEEALAAAPGLWSMELLEELYQAALAADDLRLELAWQLGPWDEWVKEGQVAKEIARRLSDYAADALAPWLVLPVDLALSRQFPGEEMLETWLAAFVAQASPFLRYDETALTQEARSQVHRQVWLFLPQGEASPLAHVCQRWLQPPFLLKSRQPQEVMAVVIRRGLPLATLSDAGPAGIWENRRPAEQEMEGTGDVERRI